MWTFWWQRLSCFHSWFSCCSPLVSTCPHFHLCLSLHSSVSNDKVEVTTDKSGTLSHPLISSSGLSFTCVYSTITTEPCSPGSSVPASLDLLVSPFGCSWQKRTTTRNKKIRWGHILNLVFLWSVASSEMSFSLVHLLISALTCFLLSMSAKLSFNNVTIISFYYLPLILPHASGNSRFP